MYLTDVCDVIGWKHGVNVGKGLCLTYCLVLCERLLKGGGVLHKRRGEY